MLFGCTCKPGEYETVSQAGFDYVEFPCRVICEMEDDAFEILCGLVKKTGVPVMGMNLYCPPEIIIAGPGYDTEKAIAYARKAAVRCSALGVRIVGIGSPRSRTIPDGFDREIAKSQLHDFLCVTAAEFDKFGITVAMEALGPCLCNFINTVSEAQEAVIIADKNNLKIVIDFYNMEHSGEADIDIEPFADLIVHAHISDDDGTPTQRSYLHPEKYTLHQKRISRLMESGYKSGLTIEIDIPFDNIRAQENLRFLRSI